MVHEYFEKRFEGFKVLLQLNPATFSIVELTIESSGQASKRKLTVDENIYNDLKEDGFERTSPLKFNLYLKGLV